MKNISKLLALVLCLVMCVAMFAACNKDNTPDNAGASPSPDASADAGASPSSSGGGASTPESSAPIPTSTGPDLLAPAPTEEDVRYAEHINVIIDATPIAVLNPYSPSGTGMSTNWAYGMYLDRLMIMENDGSYTPALATSWETDDFQTYIFHLRDDVDWHNGDHFTAHDVVAAIERAKETAAGAPCYDYWLRVDTATALDDYTLELVATSVNVDIYYGLSIMYCGIVNVKAIDEDPEFGPWVGTGAFKVVGFESRDFVEFVRNDDYWGTMPITESMTWKYIPEMTTRTIMLQNGEFDICYELPENDLELFADNPDFIFMLSAGANPFTLQLNQDYPLMADKNFKLAVAHALDRDEISLFASGEIARYCPDGSAWAYGTPHRNTDLPIHEQDLDLAKQYLDASPYNGEEIVLTTALGYNIRAAETVQEQLGKIGIKITINQLDSAGFQAATVWTENKEQMVIWQCLLGSSPFGFLNSFLPGAVHNRSKLVDTELEQILRSLPTITDENEQDALWKRAQEIVYEYNCAIPIFYRYGAVVGRAGTGGITLPPSGLNDMRNMYIIEN